MDTDTYDNHTDGVSAMGENDCRVVADQNKRTVFVVDYPSAGLSRRKGDKMSGSVVSCAGIVLDGDVDDVCRLGTACISIMPTGCM